MKKNIYTIEQTKFVNGKTENVNYTIYVTTSKEDVIKEFNRMLKWYTDSLEQNHNILVFSLGKYKFEVEQPLTKSNIYFETYVWTDNIFKSQLK